MMNTRSAAMASKLHSPQVSATQYGRLGRGLVC